MGKISGRLLRASPTLCLDNFERRNRLQTALERLTWSSLIVLAKVNCRPNRGRPKSTISSLVEAGKEGIVKQACDHLPGLFDVVQVRP